MYKGYAVTLPNQFPSSFDVMQTIRQQNDGWRRQQIQERKEEEARQAALTHLVGQNFDPKDYDTALDKQVSDLNNSYAQLIHDQPNLSQADLSMLMRKDLGNLSQYNNSLKLARASIKEQADAFKLKGIDYNGAERAALSQFLYKRDDKGNLVLRKPDELQAPDDMVRGILYNNPGHFLTKGADVWDDLKGTQVSSEGKDYTYTDKRRGSVTKNYDFSFYQPYQKLQHAEGKDPEIVPRSQTVNLQDGTPVQIADDQAYAHYMKDPVRELALRKRYLADPKHKGIDPDSPQGEVLLRGMVLDDISQIGPVKKQITEKTKAQPIIRIHMPKADTVGDDHPVNLLVGALNGDANVLSTALDDPDTGMKNLLPSLGGNWYQPDVAGGGRAAVTKMLVDPRNPGAGLTVGWRDYKTDADGNIMYDREHKPLMEDKEKTYTPGELPAYLQRSINANGDRKAATKALEKNPLKKPVGDVLAPPANSVQKKIKKWFGLGLDNNN
jgi:hypothetical protein